MYTDPDPAIFVDNLQGANKKLVFSKFFFELLFKGTFAKFLKNKSEKSQNGRN